MDRNVFNCQFSYSFKILIFPKISIFLLRNYKLCKNESTNEKGGNNSEIFYIYLLNYILKILNLFFSIFFYIVV